MSWIVTCWSCVRCEVETGEEDKKGTKKTRKRVRFDLNVQTFEPAQPSRYENYCSDDDEDGKGEPTKATSSLDLSSSSVYPPNYRYHNCVDSFEEEEDELGYGESDLEDEDYYTDDENEYEDDADDEDEEDYEDKDVTPLLNPVENITQWKAVKAKPARVKELMKENVEVVTDDQAKQLLKEIIVNTSLSSWVSPFVDITNMEKR